MGQPLKNAPVFFTIGQVVHNPLLSLSNYLPHIQERMRKSGFPDFKRTNQMRIMLPGLPGAEGSHDGQPQIQQTEIFHFASMDGTRTFILESTALSLYSTTYNSYEEFFGQFKVGLEILSEAVGGLDYSERLGLRYLNAVSPEPTEALSLYVDTVLLGLPEKMPNSIFGHTFTESAIIVEGVGQIMARAITQAGKLALPPDLANSMMKLQPRFEDISGVHTVLDIDGSRTGRHPFNIHEIQAGMSALHQHIEECFNASVTEHALKVWNA